MKDIKIALLLVAVSFPIHTLVASGDEVGVCRKVVMTFMKGHNYLHWSSLGESSFDELRVVKGRRLERYFLGDPIRCRLYLGSMCSEPPLRREAIESAPVCLSLRVYRMEKNDKGKYRQVGDEPFAEGRLDTLKIDANESWNIKHKAKLRFRSEESHNEGLFTEYFDVGDVMGRSLPVGTYLLQIVADDENCPIHFIMNLSKRWVRVLDPDTPKLRAYKLCREAGKILKGRREDVEVLDNVISEKIMPALEIDPGAVCAFSYLAHYNRVIGNREEFEKYYRMSCEGQADEHFREVCFRSLRYHLANWDNPRWWGKEKRRQEEKSSTPEKKVKGGPSREAWKLCRKASKIKRKGYHDREAWDRAVKEYFLPALEIDPKCYCALDKLSAYYRDIKKDRQKYIEYTSRMCEALSVNGLRQVCPAIRPAGYDGSCEDAPEERLRDFCHESFVDRMVEKMDWGD